MTTAEASELSQDMHLAAGHSMAQITPGGLRLYDAEGSCSMVPLDELKQIMGKLSFSRCNCTSVSKLCSSAPVIRSRDWLLVLSWIQGCITIAQQKFLIAVHPGYHHWAVLTIEIQ